MGKKIFRNPNFQETDYRLTDNPSPHFTTKVEEKIKHDHKCEKCGKPAEMTTEKVWISYTIDKDGNFKPNPYVDDETLDTHFWCESCFLKSGNWE